MFPRSGFRSERTREHANVPVFVPGRSGFRSGSFRFSFRGNIRQNHPFGKPPFLGGRFGYFPFFSVPGWRKEPPGGVRGGGLGSVLIENRRRGVGGTSSDTRRLSETS